MLVLGVFAFFYTSVSIVVDKEKCKNLIQGNGNGLNGNQNNENIDKNKSQLKKKTKKEDNSETDL